MQDYAITLAKQIGKRSTSQHLGLRLLPDELDKFSPEQVAQLYELFQETQKAIDPDQPLGNNPHLNPASQTDK